MKKFQFFYQNHGPTPLKKSWFFDFFNFLFFIVLKHFVLSRITSSTFCWLILPKIKTWKNFKFLTKTMVLTLSHPSHPSHLTYLITLVILLTLKSSQLSYHPSHPSHPSYISYPITPVIPVTSVISVISSPLLS